MKKLISFLLCFCLILSVSCIYSSAEAEILTVYHGDGSQTKIDSSALNEYTNNGWYTAPVVTIYTIGDVSSVVYKSDVQHHLSNGWFDAPVVKIYKPNGETSIVYKSDADIHLSEGWYMSPADFPKKAKAVALTYDDGPSKYTPQILDCLQRYNAKATFFVVGNCANTYPDTLLRAYNMGMEIGNHTLNHPKLTSISSSSVSYQLNTTANIVENITGARPYLVRPPYGSYNSSVLKTANAPFILWSIDTLDWKTRNAQKTVNAVLSNVKDGDIILMHDLYGATAEATETIVPALIEMGFDLVTVSELAERKGADLSTPAAHSRFK